MVHANKNATKKMIGANKARSVKNEVRILLRALRLIGNPRIEASTNLSPDPARAAVLADAWRTEQALSMAAAALHRLESRVPEVRAHLMEMEGPNYERARTMVEGWIRRYLKPSRSHKSRTMTPETIIRILRGMTPKTRLGSFGVRTLAELKMRLEQGVLQSQNAIRVLHGHTKRGDYHKVLAAHGGETGYWIQTETSDTHEISCAETDKGTFWTAVIGVILVGIIGAIADALGEGGWFNETDDDEARAEIEKSPCEYIMQNDDAYWISRFDALIDGPTGDDDEAAMLKVLNCLPCARVQTIVANYGVQSLMDEFNGSEWDSLVKIGRAHV